MCSADWRAWCRRCTEPPTHSIMADSKYELIVKSKVETVNFKDAVSHKHLPRMNVDRL